MRKLLLLLVILAAAASAQVTPNLGLNTPTHGAPNWDILLNANFVTLDGLFPCLTAAHAAGTISYWNGTSIQCLAGNSSGNMVLGEDSSGVPSWVVNGSGTVASGTLGQPAIYTVTGTAIGSSNQTVDASAFSGADWLAKTIAAATSISNVGTVIVPPSLASTAAYPSGSIPTGITLMFTGSGDYGVCTLTLGKFSKYYNPGAARLKMNVGGSGCTGITHSTQATLQENDQTIVVGARVDCSLQPGSQGMTFTGGSAQDVIRDVDIAHCGTAAGGAGFFYQDQFGHLDNVNLWANYVGLKMYTTDAQPGVSSNTFQNLHTNGSTSGVNVILSNSNTGGQTQADNVFINHQCQNGTIACVAVFGGTSGYMFPRWIGGAPELNGGGAASITIDGLVVKQAGAWYVNNATVALDQIDFSDGTADPDMVLESHANMTVTNSTGYGPQFGKLVTTDSTSFVSTPGALGTNGTMTGVASFPSNIVGGRGAMAGSPVSRLDSAVPTTYTGNPLTPPFSSTTGTSSNATATDALYGTVNTVTFAGSAGSSSTNRIVIANAIPNTTAVISDYLISILTKASVDTNVQFGTYDSANMGFKFGTNVTLYAGQWTRILMWNRGVAAGTSASITVYPNDTAGAVVSFTRLESLAYPEGSTNGTVTGLASAWARNQVIQFGAVNPNNGSGNTSVKLCGTTTTCANTIQLNSQIVYGTVALVSGTPSTATLTALPFTGTTTYVCTGAPVGTTAVIAGAGIAFSNVSASSTTLTGPDTVTTVIDYSCVGN